MGEPPAGADVVGRHSRLVGRTLLLALSTFASRVLGFVREALAAALFGDASVMFDAFVTAWRVPNLFRRFLGEGALSTALQTSLTEADGKHGEAAGRTLFLATMRTLTWVLLLLTGAVMVLVWFVPDTMPFTGWRWLGESPAAVRDLTLRMMPFVVLVCLSAICTGALQVRGRFGLPALAPIAMNVVWIGALAVIGWHFGWNPLASATGEEARQLGMVRWLAGSVLIGGVVLILVQLPALAGSGLVGGPRVPFEAGQPSPVWRVLKRTAPLAFGAAVYQINVTIDGFMAVGLLAEGGPTAHYLATRLQQLPMALSSIAAASAIFPALSAMGSKRLLAPLRGLHDRAQLAVLLFALPSTVGLFLLAEPIVSVCLGHGEFGAEGVRRTASALRYLALSIVPAGAVGLVARCYYALDDFRTPVRVSVFVLLANIGLNVLFLVGLGMDVEGLALSAAVTSWANLALLWPGLVRRLGLPRARPGGLGTGLGIRRRIGGDGLEVAGLFITGKHG
jgi:putative peptidoglycan lipid II flippase